MKILSKIFFITFFIFVSIIAQTNIPLKNNGFESGKNNWKVDSKSKVEVDNSIKKTGNSSIFIEHSNFDKTVIESENLNLKVGQLYKLSGWVKTEKAYADPTTHYPTALAACLSMESFPFSSHSQTAGATNNWKKVEIIFVATKSKDKVRVHLGYNGTAKGKVWFDDIELSEVNDITAYIPKENIKYFDKGFRYDNLGWIFIHAEGKPYERGYQYGYLVANELATFITKLAVSDNAQNPGSAWQSKRFSADAMMLRRYEVEYLEEMKGIADGATKAGATIFNRPVDLLDVVTMNSAIDIDYAIGALRNTPHPLTGQSFLAQEDELNIPEKLHKCSAFLAHKSATKDGGIVFGQIFMWGGYTGPHWNVIVDVIPTDGNRLVYQTYPGGIHSGADFYMNSAGIMIGETTVMQSPLNVEGRPMSNRIRKAAQYANSVDDVVKYLGTENNGMYTNDWLIGDVKRNEIAIYLLGTKTSKLWRSSKGEFYDNQKDWYWSNNNNKSMEVRKEYIYNPSNAPYDLMFRPANRDIGLYNFYKEKYGKIDAVEGVNLWASSPTNRPHACDGKIVTSEMAEQLVFLGHYGKTTMREKFVNENGRIPDLPNAIPRLALGYETFSPIYFTKKIKELQKEKSELEKTYKKDFVDLNEIYSYDKRYLWKNTVFPASMKESWFISSTASYYNMLNSAPKGSEKFYNYIKDELNELNSRYLYILSKEGTIKSIDAKDAYDQYKYYQIPRIKGTFALHQLRLLMGNEKFNKSMLAIHDGFKEKEIKNSDIINYFEKNSGLKLSGFINQWLERDDLPSPEIKASVENVNSKFNLKLEVIQNNNPYHFITTISIFAGDKEIIKKVEVKDASQAYNFELSSKPEKIVFNQGFDIPVKYDNFYTSTNYFDDFEKGIVVYGTNQQLETNHTLGLRFAKALADRFTEVIPSVYKDTELSEEDLAKYDLLVVGGVADNSLTQLIAENVGLKLYKNKFEWNGKVYADANDGLFLALPSPFNKERTVYLHISNSGLQTYQMTKTSYRVPTWAIFKDDRVVEKGYFPVDKLTIKL